MTFDELKFKPLYDGVQAIVDFGKYELSVVCHEFSYGGKSGLYEIAVFEGNEQKELPGITKDGDTVQGWLSKDALNGIFKKMYAITGSEGVNGD